jgi:hypothetical protein
MSYSNRIRRSLPSPDDGAFAEMVREYPSLTVDHIIPKKNGGTLDIGNTQMLTSNRNHEKDCKFWWRHPFLPTCQPYGIHHLPEDYWKD